MVRVYFIGDLYKVYKSGSLIFQSIDSTAAFTEARKHGWKGLMGGEVCDN